MVAHRLLPASEDLGQLGRQPALELAQEELHPLFFRQAGRLLAVVIMFVGVGLFLRLLQAIFRPSKVRFECPDCGLLIHDVDAVHCKHCGRVLHIPDEGIS